MLFSIPTPTRSPLKQLYPVAVLALGCALFTLLFAAPAAAQDAQAEADQAEQTAQAAASVWWNQARFIDRIALGEDLRTQMDALLAAHMEKSNAAARKAEQKKLSEALAAGEWDQAMKAVEGVNATRSEAFSQQTDLKIAVLKLLEPNQRQALKDNFPRLIDRPWVRPQRAGAKNSQRNRRQR